MKRYQQVGIVWWYHVPTPKSAHPLFLYQRPQLIGRVPLTIDAIHGDRSQRDREAALQQFRLGSTQARHVNPKW